MALSRTNNTVRHLRRLGADAAYRRECGEFLGAGVKLLEEAHAAGLEVTCELTELTGYISGMKSAPDVVFSAKIPDNSGTVPLHSGHAEREVVLVLEDIQDPGNVGTMLRTACALGVRRAVLLGGSADVWSLKALRASMGAAFRVTCEYALPAELPLVGAVVHGGEDIRTARLPHRFALAIGNEGHGLSAMVLSQCAQYVRIPIASESLNAASATAILLWECCRSAVTMHDI